MDVVLKAMFQRVVAYPPVIAKATGSAKLTILWSQIQYWSDKTSDPEGWVFKSHKEIFDETGLTRKETDTARDIGKKLGVLDTKVKGTPPVVHYRVDIEAMVNLISAYLKKNPEKETKMFHVERPESSGNPGKKKETYEIPEWLDKKAWDEWEQYRKEKRKPMTPLARKKAIAFLEQQKADHVEIIETSIRNSWTGLFPIKRNTPRISDAEIRAKEKKDREERERAAIMREEMSRKRSPEEQAKINQKLSEMRGSLKSKMKM